MIESKLDKLKPGLTHSKSKKRFYDDFKKTIGVYPTLALLGLNSRSQVFMSELKMIAHIAEMYTPIKLLNYDIEESNDPKVCFVGKYSSYIIRFETQVKIKNEDTNKYFSPDLKLTIIQSSNNEENEIGAIAVEYEGHSSHVDPAKVKSAFLRNRHITYNIGGSVLPYYKEELDSNKSRKKTLNTLYDFINQKIVRFEEAAVFASKYQLLPIIKNSSRTRPNSNIQLTNEHQVESIYISVINLINYIEYQKKDAPYQHIPDSNVSIMIHNCHSELATALYKKGRATFRNNVAFVDLREFSYLEMYEKIYLADRISVILSKVFKEQVSYNLS